MPVLDFFPQIDQSSLMILGAAFLVALIIQIIPILFYPFDLFFTMIHELGHVFTARFSNGLVDGFWVFSNTEGVTDARFPKNSDLSWYISGGYVGTSLFSAFLILLTGLPELAPYSLGFLGGLILLLLFLYGKQSKYPKKNVPTVTAIVAVSFGILLIGVAWLASLIWSIFLLYLLAIQGTITSLHLVIDDLSMQVLNKQQGIDPVVMKERVGCTPMFWVVVWSLLSIFAIGAAFWFTWLRNWPV